MNNIQPFFSIIIPTLNEQKYLPNLLRDLVKQTNTDFEVIVSDGESADKTTKKALEFSKHLPIKVVSSSQKNVCFQRNFGAKHAEGDYLIFMDADNRIPKYYLQGLRYQIDKNHPQLFTTYIEADGKHSLDITLAQVINTAFQAAKNTKAPITLEALIGVKRNLFKKIGGFDESVKWGEGGVLIKKYKAKGHKYSVFKEPKYTYSLRRVRKEGSLKLLRSWAPLALAHQTGIKLDDKIIQKLYPMLGGTFFDSKLKPVNTFEQIIKDLTSRYQLTQKIDALKKPFTKPANGLKKIFKDLI